MDSFLKQYCSPEWQEFVEFHKLMIEFDAGTLIFKEGDPVKGLFIVNTGKVKVYNKVYNKETDEKENIIRLAADGEVVGHRGFGGNWIYPVSAKTYEKTIITFIPLTIFNIVAKANAEFTYQLMMFFANELRISELNIMNIPVKNRIAKAILTNYHTFGADPRDNAKISLTIPRKDYANMVSTTYETVIRVFSELNKEKIIELKGKSIRILDFDKLNNLSKTV